MKKLIFIIGILIGQFCLGQSINYNKSNKLSMGNEVVPYFEEFIEDARKRGFYVTSFLISRIDYIHFHDSLGTSEGDNRIGIVGDDMRGFFLSPTLKGNPIKLRVTIYHEIGHIIKQSGTHTCDYCYDIMSGTAPRDLSPYLKEEFWSLKVDEYFEWLNKKE
jgi:hypothetical protein